MKHERDAAARVRDRINAWVKDEGHGSKTRLAKAVAGLYGEPRSPSWVTDITDGPDNKGQDLRLRDLDAVAACLGVPPGDLVRREDDHYLEVTPSEMRMLRYFRAMPDVIRGHLMAYIDYLGGFQDRALADQATERNQRTASARQERQADLSGGRFRPPTPHQPRGDGRRQKPHATNDDHSVPRTSKRA